MFKKILESFLPKVGELLADYARDTLTSATDFEPTFGSLQRYLKSLSAKASDVEEQIKTAELSGKKKRKREVENWLTEVKSIEAEFLELATEVESEGFISKFMCGGQAAQLSQRVHGLVEESRHFGELLLDVYEPRGEALLTTKPLGKAFDENLERIWRLLVTDKVSSIGIHGMGGVGKTTLTKHIHNRLLEKKKECVLIWITVSQEFTIKKLQDEIAQAVSVQLSGEDNEDKRAATLHRALSQRKNTVLILDDVWKYINLEKVGYPLSVDGCRLIVTTRSLEVCRQIGCRELITVKPLHTDEAWNLFSETLGKEIKLAAQVGKIAKSMAELCDGLPLGIITLAGSMRGETDIHVWRNALEELKESIMGQGDMEDEVFQVLKYSFDRLNPKHGRQRQSNGYNSLQLCFLYLSLYPEDFEIQKNELVANFISEELTDKRKSRKAQYDQGHSIVDKLVNVCLLESGDESVKMHDLVRAMALKINEGKTLVRAGHYSSKEIPLEEEWTEDLEKVSLMMNSIKEIPPSMSPNCPKLSTLLLRKNPLNFLPGSFFSQIQGLCTLDLCDTRITELPNSLSDLLSLKALLLKGCLRLKYVPYLGKLKALRELDLSDTSITEVPQGIEELINLKLLSLTGAEMLEMFPAGLLLKFPHLQRLNFPDHIDVPVEEIEGLKQLEEFIGRVKNICDFNRLIRSWEIRAYDIFYYIHVGSAGYAYWEHFECDYPIRSNNVNLSEYNLKKKLKLVACEGLSNCFLDDFSRLLSNPRSLETLEIYECGGIECMLTSEQLMTAPAELQSYFSTLESIYLQQVRDIKGVILKPEIEGIVVASPPPPPPQPPREAAVFSSLTQLIIRDCIKMKKLGIPVSEFPNLEFLEVTMCEEIEEIIADEEGREEGEARSVSLPKLKRLTLVTLPRLKTICKATMMCTSIEIIELMMCPTLKKLPLGDVPPPSLKEIYVESKEWWESLEWDDPTHPHLLKPFLHIY